MTNKTEMVSVPRELLEGLLHCAALSASAPYRELRAVLDAPAEDVRAAVEEPVYLFIDEQGMPRWTVRWDVAKHLPCYVKKAYFNPQRPVVFPERIIGQQHGDKIAEAEQRGWNACLDAVEELNKC